jgi:hypothetical protein
MNPIRPVVHVIRLLRGDATVGGSAGGARPRHRTR